MNRPTEMQERARVTKSKRAKEYVRALAALSPGERKIFDTFVQRHQEVAGVPEIPGDTYYFRYTERCGIVMEDPDMDLAFTMFIVGMKEGQELTTKQLTERVRAHARLG